jgi:glycosyltransferase involved in cell wall biosynthesis
MRRRDPGPEHEGAIGGAGYARRRRRPRGRRDPRPRVLQLLATGGNGGAQESYTGLLLHLDRSRYDVRAVSLSAGSAVQRLRRLGIGVEVIDATSDADAVRELTGYLRREEIDLLHAHMFRAEVVGTRAAVAAGTPVIVATVHSSRVRSMEDVATLAALTTYMDRLIVPSSSIEAKVRAEGRRARFAVIPNGVDLERFSSRAPSRASRSELGVPDDALLLGVVARLEPEKGHIFLLEAMPAAVAACPSAWLLVVGEGTQESALRQAAEALPPPARDRISFTGRREDVSALTAEMDVAVLPSLREAQGISLLEAMAHGRPLVASDVGGIPEVVTNGVTGLLVPPGDSAALARAVITLLADPALRRQMGEAGRRVVAERFSVDAQVRRIEAVYDEELRRAGVRTAADVAGPPQGAVGGRGGLELPPV